MSNKGFCNGKAAMDNVYGMFLNMPEYKLADRGKYFVRTDRWYPSSQICSSCGPVHEHTYAWNGETGADGEHILICSNADGLCEEMTRTEECTFENG